MNISTNCIELIKDFEGCKLRSYKCPSGVWTIGYGHTSKVNGKAINSSTCISKEQAIKLLKEDLAYFENAVNTLVKVNLTQNQFDSLVSFVYNIGITNFRNSTLLKYLNNKNYTCAADEFSKWVYGSNKVKLAGLVRRRKSEQQLFLADTKLTSANDIIWEISQKIPIDDVDSAVFALDIAKKENSSLYWILYKIANGVYK